MIVSIRVAPSVDGKLTQGTADSAPYSHLVGRLVGRLGHFWERFDLNETQLRELRDARVFSIVEGDRSRPRNLVKLAPRTPRGKIMKLANGGAV